MTRPGWAACCATLLWLGGCGVGVGGTGTGEDLAPFGAAAASVCGASIAPALACPTVGGAAADGSASRPFVDADSNGRVVAVVDGNRIELEARCLGVRFAGTWGIGVDNLARYFGTATIAGERVAQLAVLEVSLQPSTNQRELQMVVNNARGEPLVPRMRYRAVDALPAPLPACP